MRRATPLKDVAPVGTVLVSTLSAPQYIDALAVIDVGLAGCPNDFLAMPVDVSGLGGAGASPATGLVRH
jgi:hypothetical protein